MKIEGLEKLKEKRLFFRRSKKNMKLDRPKMMGVSFSLFKPFNLHVKGLWSNCLGQRISFSDILQSNDGLSKAVHARWFAAANDGHRVLLASV